MDQVKEAFRKVKEDMEFLKSSLNSLTLELAELKKTIEDVVHNLPKEVPNISSYEQTNQQTDRQTNQTPPTHNPTQNMPFKPQKPQNLGISIGNQGVPTDRQTNQQTDRQTHNPPDFSGQSLKPEISNKFISSPQGKSIDNAFEILNSLDGLKKEIRIKFKGLTDQEFLVFSTLYQFDEEYGFSDYKTLSKHLHLSESSIRDYIGRLLKKDIPVEKIKVNNKTIHLAISQNLKKIASLQTILQLRGL